MDINDSSGFFVRLPLDDTLRAMKEVGNAFPLFWWFCGRVTREYSEAASGVRVGAVLGGAPNADRGIAADLTRAGFRCTGDQVYLWRRRLAEKGYVAVLRAPYGTRVYVIDSNKFPEDEAGLAPEWLTGPIFDAIRASRGRTVNPTEERTVNPTEGSVNLTEGSVNLTVLIKKEKGNRKESEVERRQQKNAPLAFDSHELRITAYQDQTFAAAFPWVDRQMEYLKMRAWLIQNPRRQKKNHGAFAYRWLAKIEQPEQKRRKEGWDDELDIPLAERPF
ncbi:MAG: hypothetical protein ACRD1I_07175 [Terriglobia bacterium]